MENSITQSTTDTVITPIAKTGSVGKSKPGILCLDLGQNTGWALRSRHGGITSGTAEFKNSRWQGGGMIFLRFTRFLTEIHQSEKISMVFYEEVRRHKGTDAAHNYGGFWSNLIAWCELNEIAYEGVPVGTIKRHATGKGGAAKELVIQSVVQRGHNPANDDEADALALLYWALKYRDMEAV